MNGDHKEVRQPSQEPAGEWRFTPENAAPPQTSPAATQPSQPYDAAQYGPMPAYGSPQAAHEANSHELTWTASEFISHDKGAAWFTVLIAIAVVLAGLVLLLTRDVISVLFVGIAVVLFGVMAARKPRTLTYRMTDSGIAIGPKYYPFAAFRSFAVVDEGAFTSIMFIPMKRFMPPVSMYYDPKDEHRIFELLTLHLPMTHAGNDPIDKLMRRIRF